MNRGKVLIVRLMASGCLLYSSTTFAQWGLQDWGELIWGAGNSRVVQIPTVNIWVTIAFALYVLVAGFLAHRFSLKRVVPFVVVLVAPFVAIGVPHVFQNGTVADADQVNENFSDIESQIDSETFIVKLTATNEAVAQAIDDTRMVDLCADDLGCRIRFCARHLSSPSVAICELPTNFAFDSKNRRWVMNRHTIVGGQFIHIQDVDGDNNVEPMFALSNCIVSDEEPRGGDSEPGFTLFLSQVTPKTTCELMIED